MKFDYDAQIQLGMWISGFLIGIILFYLLLIGLMSL